MNFYSILFKSKNSEEKNIGKQDFFSDLNLNQLKDAVCTVKADYDIEKFFYAPLDNKEEIQYRQDIMRDLENADLFESISKFSQNMQIMRDYLLQSSKSYYKFYKERLFLNSVEVYCNSLITLENNLFRIQPSSEGFGLFHSELKKYINSDEFTLLFKETKRLTAELADIRYNVLIKENAITVSKYENEEDLGRQIENTFKRFQQGTSKELSLTLPPKTGMNHIEAKILEFVAKLFPETFSSLCEYCDKNRNFENSMIKRFENQIQFYLAYFDYIEPLKNAGLNFCYPKISDGDKEIYAYKTFDLILAEKLKKSGAKVVSNDFYLKKNERVFVVSGPNQGGKTTFARMFGQVHYLSKLGFCVPAKEAKLFLYDSLFTHFEKEESIFDLRGKLEDDIVRVNDILKKATPYSIVIMNEVFASTTFADAAFLSKKIMEKILERDLLCVWVTFIDELTGLSSKIVSMVAQVAPDNPSVRTHKVIRKAADGVSYAISIAQKYHVTYDCIKERLRK